MFDERYLCALVVGAGPGGLAPLFAAAHAGTLTELLDAGITILERESVVGSGALEQYTIRSDSAAEAFLDIVARTTEPDLSCLQSHPLAESIAESKGKPIALKKAGEFLKLAGEALCKRIDAAPKGSVLRGHEAIYAKRISSGMWSTRVRCRTTGAEKDIYSRSLILATGAEQREDRLRTEQVAGLHLLPMFENKLIQTGSVFTANGLALIEERLASVAHPKVVIVGGSTSAGAATRLVLEQFKHIAFDENSVTLMHRRPLNIFYNSREEAHADGYTAFTSRDVCPVSGRVFRLSGFRHDTRETIMAALKVGGRTPDPRLQLFHLGEKTNLEAKKLLDEADLIIAGLGYRPRALPLLDWNNTRIPLQAESDKMLNMVDTDCRVLDHKGSPIEGVYGIGLATGFIPSGNLGGEESFQGQANSLWLWQHDVGQKIVDQILGANQQVAVSKCSISTAVGMIETPLDTVPSARTGATASSMHNSTLASMT